MSGLTTSSPFDVNTSDDHDLGAIFSDIAPDINGKIRVYVNTVSNTDVADISGIQISMNSLTVTLAEIKQLRCLLLRLP